MSSENTNSTNQPTKKPYSAPRLLVYGDVKELTKSAGNKALAGDGPPHGQQDKTS
jgi:hypothetical protein